MAKGLQHELERRRVFIFLAVFFFVAMLLDAFTELDVPAHAVDDFGIAALSLIAILYVAASRKHVDLKALVAQNNIVVALFVIALLFQIYGLVVEGGTNDFGDEIPVLIGLIITIANRFT